MIQDKGVAESGVEGGHVDSLYFAGLMEEIRKGASAVETTRGADLSSTADLPGFGLSIVEGIDHHAIHELLYTKSGEEGGTWCVREAKAATRGNSSRAIGLHVPDNGAEDIGINVCHVAGILVIVNQDVGVSGCPEITDYKFSSLGGFEIGH
jgi:hypothetical protein